LIVALYLVFRIWLKIAHHGHGGLGDGNFVNETAETKPARLKLHTKIKENIVNDYIARFFNPFLVVEIQQPNAVVDDNDHRLEVSLLFAVAAGTCLA
jgi:hypothetical protein